MHSLPVDHAPYARSVRDGHIIVCGDSALSQHLVSEFISTYRRNVTVILPSAHRYHGPQLASLARQHSSRLSVLEAENLNEAVLTESRVSEAASIAFLSDDHEENFRAASSARNLNPELHLVIRRPLGHGNSDLTRLSRNSPGRAAQAQLGGASVDILCETEIASPSLAATLTENKAVIVKFGQRIFRATMRKKASQGDSGTPPVIALFADVGVSEDGDFLPPGCTQLGAGVESQQVLVLEELREYPKFKKLGAVGTKSMPFIPFATNLQLRALEEHVVVVGLGAIGSSVMECLHDLGVPVVGIDRSPTAQGVFYAKKYRIPVVIGDATDEETLESARITRSRAIFAATGSDSINLESILAARERNPKIQSLPLLENDDLAHLISQGSDIFRSAPVNVAALAAPVFAAAMLRHRPVTVIPIGNEILLLTQMTVGRHSSLTDQPLFHGRSSEKWKVLGFSTPRIDLTPDYHLQPEDQVLVMATRQGLAHLLES